MLSLMSIFIVTETTLTQAACYTHYWGWAKGKTLGSLPVSRVQQLIWTLSELSKVLTLQKPVFGERVGMCGSRKASGWSGGGGFVGNCARTSFLVRILYFLILTEPRNTTKVFLETSKIFGRPFYKHFASCAFLSRASDRCPRKGMNFTKITWIPRDCHWTFISNSVNLCGLTRASDLSHFSFKQKEQSGRPN